VLVGVGDAAGVAPVVGVGESGGVVAVAVVGTVAVFVVGEFVAVDPIVGVTGTVSDGVRNDVLTADVVAVDGAVPADGIVPVAPVGAALGVTVPGFDSVAVGSGTSGAATPAEAGVGCVVAV
jgi:hypothetical protein